jgi:hypothetical protein
VAGDPILNRYAPEFTFISPWLHRRFTPVPQSVRHEEPEPFTRGTI